MFVRLFVDENLDRMVPISKQPKEKIQAIIESCHRQFPEFQERARKRIRTYLKSCRRTRKHGSEQQSRPPPAHLTSALAETILATACENESQKAAKRMRLESQLQDNAIVGEHCSQHALQPLELIHPAAHSAYSALPSPVYEHDPLPLNGSGRYGRHGFPNAIPPPAIPPLPPPPPPTPSIGNGLCASPLDGPTDLSLKRTVNGDTGSSGLILVDGSGIGKTPPGSTITQLSSSEVSAVRQLIAGYRESAAFLLRSAEELENLILQQN
uniref:Nucleolar protein 4 helical domain-containing protein n=1 Tax=Eptatretus burgeri TaxID=7764 RepID=A0A8C4QY49_EPTBU